MLPTYAFIFAATWNNAMILRNAQLSATMAITMEIIQNISSNFI